jgi:hypothetical protein
MHARLFQVYRSMPATPAPTDSMSPPITPNVASGCTWHTIPEPSPEFWPQSYRPPLSIAQHLPPSILQQQVHDLMSSMSGHVDLAASAHVTDVLINTANGINMLKRTLGEHVVGSLVALLLKDHQQPWEDVPPPPPSPTILMQPQHQPWFLPHGSPVISSAQASGLLPEGLLE